MTGPAVQPAPGGSSTTLEEYEAATSAPAAPPKASDFKLEGDDIPEEFRGKTAAEIAVQAKAAMSALRTSEESRLTMKSALETRQPVPAPVVEPVEEPVMTREQLAELYATDPIAAMEKVTEIAEARATKNFNTRLGQMESSGMSLAENWARQEFPDEFKLFGAELSEFVKKFPAATFSTKKGWEDAVSFVRGQRGNFEKLVEHRSNPARTPAEARQEQEDKAGHSGTGNGQRGKVPVEAPTVLDAVQMQIAQEFINSGVFKDVDEYVKWSKIGASS